jgi:pSer/pThr/pTyr-binding forkhead associated (FHA) protein
MRAATGTVVNGKIVLEDVPLAEGAVVAVVTRGADERFSLTGAQETALLEPWRKLSVASTFRWKTYCCPCPSRTEDGASAVTLPSARSENKVMTYLGDTHHA